MGLFDGDPTCRSCGKETGTVQHMCYWGVCSSALQCFWEPNCRTKRYKQSQ
jgi:hypothetical protein